MKWFVTLIFNLILFDMNSQIPKYNQLSEEEQRVILHKGTERPFTGAYVFHNQKGTYICKRCNAPLYRSEDKFESHCGWPSFDEEISGAVKRLPDPDGRRTEIVCANCNGHLGHVFYGENFTAKNIRHCVNSISLKFIPEGEPFPPVIKNESQVEIAYFAGGCFWGVEFYFQNTDGVVKTTVGYMGGTVENPTYEQVCNNTTGHAETLKVEFDPQKISFEALAKLFFEIHDPTQLNRQGPDVGTQYRSAIFYTSEQQRSVSEHLISILKSKGIIAVTEVKPASTFWPAESYHQNYYRKKGGRPYCHFRRKIF